MSTPGVSLFQGAESIQVNNSLDRAEEEEALEDQRRRNEELGNLLQNAFDDLEDDETTMDSTNNLDLIENNHINNNNNHINNHHHHQINNNNKNNSHNNNNNNNNNNNGKILQMHFNNFEAEVHQLKMLIDSRTNEMEHFKQLSLDEQRKRDELQKRLAITEAELDRALSAKTNQHELLVESKEKCSNLENTIVKLRNDKKQLEHENNTLLGKLETTQTLLGDVQRKYDMVERDLNKHNSRQEELRRKQLEERHRAEIEMMQQQMDTLTDKLERKQSELESISTRYHALQESHEKMLVDKSSRINELTNALSEAQEKCEELLSKDNYFEENIRLHKLIKQLQQQISSMEKTIENLKDRLQYTTAELDVMDSLLHQHNLDDSPRRQSRNTVNKASVGGVVSSTPINTADRVGSFKDELYRALANVKSKRDEVRKLQALLEEKSSEIKVLHDLENKSLVEITTLKEENIRLENRVKLLEQELDAQNSNGAAITEEQLKEKEVEFQSLRLQQSKLETQLKEANIKASDHETEHKKLDSQLRNLQVNLEELRQEHESLKRNHEQTQQEHKQLQDRHKEAENWHLDLERHKFLLQDTQAECQRLKKLYVEISNSKESLQYELDKLRQSDTNKQLHELREKVASLQRALQLAEVKSSELNKILEHEKESHEQEVREMRQRLEEATQKDLEQKEEINNCKKCLQNLSKITEYEIENLKLANVHATSREQIDDLSKQLSKAESTISALQEQLKLSEQQEQLISELKTKAHKFEEYIKNSSSSSSTEKSQSTEKRDSSTNTSPVLEKMEVNKLETRLREEIAQIFAKELKRFQIRLHESEEKFLMLSRENQHTQTQLKQRETEVDLLKQAILAERDKMKEMLQQQHLECVEIVAKKESLLQGCHEALKQKEQKLHELVQELQERQEQIEAERQSMKAVMCQWETQRKSNEALESEWKAKLLTLKQQHEEAMTTWQKKYNSAKRTAANYKRYAEDKEEHMLKEYDRLKSEYDASLTKIEIQMRETLEQKNREFQHTIKYLEKKREVDNDKNTNFNKENQACN